MSRFSVRTNKLVWLSDRMKQYSVTLNSCKDEISVISKSLPFSEKLAKEIRTSLASRKKEVSSLLSKAVTISNTLESISSMYVATEKSRKTK